MTNNRASSPCLQPEHFRSLSEEDLDFDDPPSYIKNEMTRTFWYINKNIRDKILEYGRGSPVYFCFHNGYCTFQVDSNIAVAKGRIDNHFSKKPHHRIDLNQLKKWKLLAEERRQMRDRMRRGSGMAQHSPNENMSSVIDRRQHEEWKNGSRSPQSIRDGWRKDSPRNRVRSPSPHSPTYSRQDRAKSPSKRHEDTRQKSPSSNNRYRSYSPPNPSWARPIFKTKLPVNSSRRTYSSQPASGMGRYNSRTERERSPHPDQRAREWVCKPRGINPGCSKVFFIQEDYRDHISLRERNKGCPQDESRPPVVTSGSSSHIGVKGEIRESLYKGPLTEITIDDLPPHVPVIRSGNASPAVSPPRGTDVAVSSPRDYTETAVSPPIYADIAVSPPRDLTISEECPNGTGIVLIDNQDEVICRSGTGEPRLRINENIFKDEARPNYQLYPVVERSPPNSPGRSSHTEDVIEYPISVSPGGGISVPRSPNISLHVSSAPINQILILPSVQRSPEQSVDQSTELSTCQFNYPPNVVIPSPDHLPNESLDSDISLLTINSFNISTNNINVEVPDVNLLQLLRSPVDQESSTKSIPNPLGDPSLLSSITKLSEDLVTEVQFSNIDPVSTVSTPSTPLTLSSDKSLKDGKVCEKKRHKSAEDEMELLLDKKKRGHYLKMKTNDKSKTCPDANSKAPSNVNKTDVNYNTPTSNENIPNTKSQIHTSSEYNSNINSATPTSCENIQNINSKTPSSIENNLNGKSQTPITSEKNTNLISKATTTTSEKNTNINSKTINTSEFNPKTPSSFSSGKDQNIISKTSTGSVNNPFIYSNTPTGIENNKNINYKQPSTGVNNLNINSKTSSGSENNSNFNSNKLSENKDLPMKATDNKPQTDFMTAISQGDIVKTKKKKTQPNKKKENHKSSERIYIDKEKIKRKGDDGDSSISVKKKNKREGKEKKSKEVKLPSKSNPIINDHSNKNEDSLDLVISSNEKLITDAQEQKEHSGKKTKNRDIIEKDVSNDFVMHFSSGSDDDSELPLNIPQLFDGQLLSSESSSLHVPSLSERKAQSPRNESIAMNPVISPVTSNIILSDDFPFSTTIDSSYSGRVTTLRRALGVESNEDTEDDYNEDDKPITLNNDVDQCENCPLCEVKLDHSSKNVSFDMSDFTMILVCQNPDCRTKIKIANVMREDQKSMWTCLL